ncbi:biotin/lipoyl-binding protein [Microbispora sp. NBC_01189]|uniref:acetyl-CoA carboxylase biotin carboxyl carrier protein n=1 Tax=Microbispora sp. NBC_01189 TaxID=2903583 RepID=UPI002E1227D6|nr:biotin/lipoyl-binding protein [Microbispora sp. NBC_01189]
MIPLHSDSAPEGGPGFRAEGTDLLERVRDAVVVLLAELPGTAERLRVRAGDIEVELGWATPAETASHPVRSTSSDLGAQTVESVTETAGLSVTAPTAGTFYLRPEPGAEPFVQVGDRVSRGRQVAIIEVMKLMIPIEAGTDAEVVDVLVEDGQPVEYGQPLLALRKAT